MKTIIAAICASMSLTVGPSAAAQAQAQKAAPTPVTIDQALEKMQSAAPGSA